MAGEPTAYEIVPVTPELAEDFLAVDQAAFFFEHSRPAAGGDWPRSTSPAARPPPAPADPLSPASTGRST